MKCISGQCNKTVQHFVISKENAVNPQTCDIGDLRQLFGFFQYKAPNTSSFQCESLDEIYHEDLFNEMMKSWKEENHDIISHSVTFDNEAVNYALFGNDICSYCKRYLCKRLKTKNGHKETDFDCFIRHIRNSIAHGRVFIIHSGNSIKVMLEDYDNINKVISGRIICNQSDLRKWRTLINSYIKKQREENEQTNS